MKFSKYVRYVLGYIILIGILVAIGIGFYVMYERGYSLAGVLLLAIYVVNLAFTTALFVQLRNSSAKLSWMMVMAIAPLIGHVIFAIFGQRYKYRKPFYEYKKRENFKYEDLSTTLESKDEENKVLFERQKNIVSRGIYKGNFKIFEAGFRSYESLFNDLRSAEKFIHLHYYIIKPGELFEELRHILVEKAQKGVEVRLIVDDFGRWALPWYEIKELEKQGVKVSIFGKVHFPFIGSENGYRTHRKVAIIDGHTVHTGGLNIADEYASLSKHYGYWIDFQTKITGKAVRSFSLLFIEDWNGISSEKLPFDKYLLETEGGTSSSIMIEDSPSNTYPVMQDSFVNMISSAKKSIYISSPYLIPTKEIISAIRIACLAGVDVNIFIPGKPDKQTVLVATNFYAQMFQEYGAKIHVVNNMLIHSKIGLFDDKYAYMGSANMDTRSLYSQFELVTLVEGEVVKDIKNIFNRYHEISTPMVFDIKKTKWLKNKILRFYTTLFSPIM